VPDDGMTLWSMFGGDGPRDPSRFADGFMQVPWVKPDAKPPHNVKQSIKCFDQPVSYKNPAALALPVTYVAAAHFHFERGELKSAKAQLQWVLERASAEDLRNLARLRLAALLLDERAYDEALALLEEKPLDAYAALYAALRGDVLVAKDRPAEARAAYQLALEKASGAFRESVQMRLDALGG
jgi:predicted negative regulator of RcsB-dependent stress response